MENKKKECSSKKHLEIDAVNYCQECKLFQEKIFKLIDF